MQDCARNCNASIQIYSNRKDFPKVFHLPQLTLKLVEWTLPLRVGLEGALGTSGKVLKATTLLHLLLPSSLKAHNWSRERNKPIYLNNFSKNEEQNIVFTHNHRHQCIQHELLNFIWCKIEVLWDAVGIGGRFPGKWPSLGVQKSVRETGRSDVRRQCPSNWSCRFLTEIDRVKFLHTPLCYTLCRYLLAVT